MINIHEHRNKAILFLWAAIINNYLKVKVLHRIYRLEFNAGLSFDKPSVFKTHYLGLDIFKHISIVYEQMLLSKAIRFSYN